MLFLVGLLCSLPLWPTQAFDIHLESAELAACDPSFISEPFLELNEKEDGNNTITTKFKLIHVLDDTCEACLSILGLSGGDYKVETGIDVCKEVCDVFDDEVILGPFLTCLGIEKDNCPPPEGQYGQEDYVPNTGNMPTALPDGDYRTIVTINCDDAEILRVIVDFSTE